MKWEYKVEGLPTHHAQAIGIVKSNAMTPQNPVQEHLAARGEEGWELIQILGKPSEDGWQVQMTGLVFVFKRPKS